MVLYNYKPTLDAPATTNLVMLASGFFLVAKSDIVSNARTAACKTRNGVVYSPAHDKISVCLLTECVGLKTQSFEVLTAPLSLEA